MNERGLVVVVGMNSEARIARPLGLAIVGADALSSDVLDRASGVLSFGLCGGLGPDLKPGDLVIGTAVDFGGRRFVANADGVAQLGRIFPNAVVGSIAGSNEIVGSARAKADLREATGAIAADMESHAVAAAALRAGVPFAILRAVSDGPSTNLPLSAQVGFRPDGSTDVVAVLRGLAARPGELSALIRTARDASKGFAALRRAAAVLPGRFPV